MKFVIEKKTIDVKRTLVEADTEANALEMYQFGNYPDKEEATESVTTTRAILVPSIITPATQADIPATS